MNAEIERLFEAALEIPLGERAEFLSQQCADGEIRREVELLLEHDRGGGTFLAQAVAGEAASVVGSLSFSRGQRLGPYCILSVIGRGGMGLVYLAERADGKFDQRVAIKVAQAGLGVPFADRLKQECRVLAGLEHPNIARLVDAGVAGDALPYFVMEYVGGQPIDRYCDEHKLNPRERVQLMLPVCEAVQFAHQKLVVHRDLKPDNILVTAEGIPKLLDFGIAKVLGEAPAGAPEIATRVLTPEYGSPEQFRGEAVSTTTDIYALGGVFYKLLTGATPHQIEGKSSAETLRAICEEGVRRPSSLRPELAGDIDHMLQMALRKEPQRRYSSADQLAADLRRWLADKPVLASPDTIWYRSGKFMRRHWLGVLAAAMVVLALASGAGVATWQARRAERRFADVRHLANVFLFDFEESIHKVPGATKARQLLVKTALEYLRSLTGEVAGDAVLTRELAAAYEKVGDIQGDPGAGNVGDTAGAVGSYQQAIALRRSLGDGDSADAKVRIGMAQALLNLAVVQSRTRDLDAAFRNCGQALSVAEALAKASPGDAQVKKTLAQAYAVMPMLLLRRNDVKGALDYAHRRLTLSQTLAGTSPQDRAAQHSLAQAYRWLGQILELTQAWSAAVENFQKALPIFESQSAQEPGNAELRRSRMVVYAELGYTQFKADEHAKQGHAKAIANMRRGYDLADRAVAADPANAEAVSDLIAIAIRLGLALGANGQGTEGGRLLQRAVGAAAELAQRDPTSREDRLNLGMAHANFAEYLANHGNEGKALNQRLTAAEIFRDLTAAKPDDAKVLLSQVWNWKEIGDLLAKQGNRAGARANYALGREVAQKLAPGNPAFAEVLADIRRAEGQVVQPPDARP